MDARTNAANDPYLDRQLVDESTHRSLILCKAALSNPTTDKCTRVSCQARIVALLDALPAIRAFDLRSKGYSIPARSQQATSSAKNRRAKPEMSDKEAGQPGDCPQHAVPLAGCRLLLNRCVAYRDLALAFRQTGDVHNAACNYQRATALLEALLRAALAPSCGLPAGEAAERNCRQAMRSFATDALIRALGDWADVERAIGRPTSAQRIQARADTLASQTEKQAIYTSK
ncbi:hypothetical protein IWW55_005641 [Coemansia sp. RSA 2706]|nr:hypothetical protein IWW55_005641 [Coemansia sp. RSA 2706]KAJ2310649.1 hypothetical protein IWW54_003078 [Coemansia sp. RSA 2705]KAJ2317142.1 hypothetical protein IWW52_003284 [Coemansia sp. RSA 2704]KAJ2327010.1 hypothetical protein IWW51_001979 [Coemansia sp. RSA 2702]KAJ2731074.1 hypothetical protein H4R23_003163 [Coemansia sp. Cherry 401B]